MNLFPSLLRGTRKSCSAGSEMLSFIFQVGRDETTVPGLRVIGAWQAQFGKKAPSLLLLLGSDQHKVFLPVGGNNCDRVVCSVRRDAVGHGRPGDGLKQAVRLLQQIVGGIGCP